MQVRQQPRQIVDTTAYQVVPSHFLLGQQKLHCARVSYSPYCRACCRVLAQHSTIRTVPGVCNTPDHGTEVGAGEGAVDVVGVGIANAGAGEGAGGFKGGATPAELHAATDDLAGKAADLGAYAPIADPIADAGACRGACNASVDGIRSQIATEAAECPGEDVTSQGCIRIGNGGLDHAEPGACGDVGAQGRGRESLLWFGWRRPRATAGAKGRFEA